MQSAVWNLLDGGRRLHLQHGPIDLIIGVDAESDEQRQNAFGAAIDRFESILEGLVAELDMLRSEVDFDTALPVDPVAQRMVKASLPYCGSSYLTPMIAVAGSVADEVLDAMVHAQPLHKAYVNNGGDIAIHLEEGQKFKIQISDTHGNELGRVKISHEDSVRGIATSGSGGRSHSFGIADSVTALASCAADADAASTLIANSVNIAKHPRITRIPANELNPDSDLGKRLVTVEVPELTCDEIATALKSGANQATKLYDEKKISGAALFLQNEGIVIGENFGILN